MPAELSLIANSEADAEQVEKLLVALLKAARVQANLAMGAGGGPDVEVRKQATAKILDSLRPTRKGAVVSMRANLYKNIGGNATPR